MNDHRLNALRDIIQEDLGKRGLATDPQRNLISECRDDFARACHSIAECSTAAVAVVTGFIIPRAEPPCGETDGPLGALFLARALVPLGIRAALISDEFGQAAFQAGLEACNLNERVTLVTLPPRRHDWDDYLANDWQQFANDFGLTHLIALERPGPSHTWATLQAPNVTHETPLRLAEILPAKNQDRFHTMGGRDITEMMSPAHLLFERRQGKLVTIGIGDGGNEIGMGKIAWEVIARNIPNGGRVACRVATDYLIVAGVSNWGAYALATGVRFLRGRLPSEMPQLYDIAEEQRLLELMVKRGPLVDGVTAQPTATVDGLTFAEYARKLREMVSVI